MQDGNIARDALKATVVRRADEWLVVVPAADAARLGLEDGDAVEIRLATGDSDGRTDERHVDAAFAAVRALRKPLPSDYRFDRDELYGRRHDAD